MSLRRDKNLRRLLLLSVRDRTDLPELEEIQASNPQLVTYNSGLLIDNGLVTGQVVPDGSGGYAAVVMIHLTDKGHDLLDQLEAEHAQTGNQVKSSEQPRTSLLVFISHSSKDEILVKALIQVIRDALNIPQEQIRCSTVSGFRLTGGKPINDQLRVEVHDSKAFVGLVTANSMKSPYVLFELGARWGAGLHLQPLLGTVADSEYLKGPLESLLAHSCDDHAQVLQLVGELAHFLKITPAASQAYHEAIQNLVKVAKDSAKARQPVQNQDVDSVQLSPEELAVMRLFSDGSKLLRDEDYIRTKTGFHPLKVSQVVSRLSKLGLLYHALRMGMPPSFRLEEKGREYLIVNNLLS